MVVGAFSSVGAFTSSVFEEWCQEVEEEEGELMMEDAEQNGTESNPPIP